MPLNTRGVLTPVSPQADNASPLSVTETPEFLRLSPTGSAVINGITSYSGADIKVVVHIYDGGKENQLRIDEYAKLLKDTTADLDTIEALASGTTPDQDTLDFKQKLIYQADYLSEEIGRLSALNTGFSTKVLAEIQSLSVSTHREKYPVRGLGSVYPKAFTRGPRSIAGSMIFTVFDKNVLSEFLEAHPSDFDAHLPTTAAIADQLPPFDITVAFANELGQVSRMTIYGVELVNEGMVMSIEDMLLENVVQYVARDIDPMRIVGRRKVDENNRLVQDLIPVRASELLNDQRYIKYKESLTPYERFKNRRKPYI